MKKLLFTILLFAYYPTNAAEYWQQFVHYTLNVSLDPDTHVLTGTETILYKNNSPDTLRQIYLHLYPNAYKDNNSHYAKELKARKRFLNIPKKDNGWINIMQFSIEQIDNSENKEISAYNIDDTILHANLQSPLAPGEELTIHLAFEEKVRKIYRRSGYKGTQYDFSQWYPKMVVYDEKGWHPEQFHSLGEFYGEFGTFDVTMDVPLRYIVASTGVVTNGNPGWEAVRVDTSLSGDDWKNARQAMKDHFDSVDPDSTKRRTVTFHAENVHDFAWSACADFLYENGDWDGIPIHVFYTTKDKKRWGNVVVERTEKTLEWLSNMFGRYPYPQVTVLHGLLGGGMEYPMLVMNGSESEGLIVHEVGHIYFYGALANNEYDEGWLDEGFTSWQTDKYLEHHYGPIGIDPKRLYRNDPDYLKGIIKSYPMRSAWERRMSGVLNFINSGHNEPIAVKPLEYKDPSSYNVSVYSKGAMLVDMLAYVVGEKNWEKIRHEYFRRWKFKHVNEQGFQSVCEDISGLDLDWFFDQWLHDALLIDYELGTITETTTENGLYLTEVEIRRNQSGVMPVDIQVITEKNDTLSQRWDGFEQSGKMKFSTASKIEQVALDPNDKILDNNRFNNGTVKYVIKPDIEFTGYKPYIPRNTYLLLARPSLWFNDVDGLRIGFKTKGTTNGRQRELRLGAWYGIDSNALDGFLAIQNPLPAFGLRTHYSARVCKLEGRFETDVNIFWKAGKYRYYPPFHNIKIGFNYSELLNDKYTRRKVQLENETYKFEEWQNSSIGRFYINYTLDTNGSTWDGRMKSRLELGQNITESKTFGIFDIEGIIDRDVSIFELKLRSFAGTILGESVPLQDLFWLDGANPRERFNSYYVRSVGALPAQLHYHQPGGPNLRGYFNRIGIADNVLAVNTELQKSVGLPAPVRKLLGSVTLSGFFDGGQLWYQDETTRLFDAGVGIKSSRKILYRNTTFRFDLPLWLSDPAYDNNEFDFRWLFSLKQVF